MCWTIERSYGANNRDYTNFKNCIYMVVNLCMAPKFVDLPPQPPHCSVVYKIMFSTIWYRFCMEAMMNKFSQNKLDMNYLFLSSIMHSITLHILVLTFIIIMKTTTDHDLHVPCIRIEAGPDFPLMRRWAPQSMPSTTHILHKIYNTNKTFSCLISYLNRDLVLAIFLVL